MPVEFDTQLVRRNNANFKLVDDSDIAGSSRVVDTILLRDGIQTALRKQGMIVYVKATDIYYNLQADLTTWAVFQSGAGGGLPPVAGEAGKFLTNDGFTVSWAFVPSDLPTQTGNAGKFLSTDGSIATWQSTPGGGLPPLAGLDGAVLRETEPGALLTFARLTQDDIDPAFAVTAFSPGFTTTKEVGDSIINPSFTASYNAALASATLQDDVDTQSLLTPFLAFAYGTPPLTARTYLKTAINATVTWVLSATKVGGTPVRTSSVGAAWRPRVYFQESTVPGSYNAAFITGLTGQALASGFARTIAFGAGGGTKKLYYAYPTAFGSPSQFKDADTGFAIPFTLVASAVAVTNAFAVAPAGGYNVWESDNFLNAAVNVQVL